MDENQKNSHRRWEEVVARAGDAPKIRIGTIINWISIVVLIWGILGLLIYFIVS